MILPIVSELLARISRRSSIEQVFAKILHSASNADISGLTDSAKALLVPIAVRELGRPAIVLVESNQRAEALVAPVRWFYQAVTGKPANRVVYLPTHDVLPYENRSPHPEISEARAVGLWRFATGEAD